MSWLGSVNVLEACLLYGPRAIKSFLHMYRKQFSDQPHLRNLSGSMRMVTGLLSMEIRIIERCSASVV
jgi:hypothetical protein